jgi:hypothetical protein
MVGWESNSRWSFMRIARRARQVAGDLIVALGGWLPLEFVLQRFQQQLQRVARRNPRSQTGTLELLRDPARLDYLLS